MRAKFYCDWLKEPYEVEKHRPNGRYYKLPFYLFGKPMISWASDAPSRVDDGMQIMEFYLQCVGEDERGQYYHYFSKGL